MDQEIRFRTLLFKFGDIYSGVKYYWLRCILYDRLHMLHFERARCLDLFNYLQMTNVLKSNDVNILLEIAELTQQQAAGDLINEYITNSPQHVARDRPIIKPYRKSLFRAVREISSSELKNILDSYPRLQYYGFTNIWDTIFYLEEVRLLRNEESHILRFANLLNLTAKTILLYGIEHVPSELRAQGAEAINAYINAKQFGTKRIYQTRLMLVGLERSGKTSLVKSFINERFDDKEESTDGIDTHSIIHITDWRPPQTEEGASKKYARAVAEKIVAELRRTGTEEQTLQSEESIEERVDEMVNIEVSTNPDEDESKDIPEEITKLVIKMLLKKDNKLEDTIDDLIVSIWDFAGQEQYYITHEVFLVSRAIYIICFDLSLDLDAQAIIRTYDPKSKEFIDHEHHMTNLDFIVFWFGSICLKSEKIDLKDHTDEDQDQDSPPVFIVGTHRNLLSKIDEEKNALAKEKLDRVFKKLEKTPYSSHLIFKHYAIDNEPRPVEPIIDELKKKIIEVAKKEHYMGDEIPIRWLDFLQKLEELKEKKSVINYEEVKDLAAKCKIIEETELFIVLKFYHDIGHIVYYGNPETKRSPLNDIVILDSRWLIKPFRGVFTDKIEKLGKFSKSLNLLKDEGLLKEGLLRHMWREFPGQFEGLLQIMEKFDLLCEKTTSGCDNERVFYAPSLLEKNVKMLNMDGLVKSTSVVMLYIDFNGFLPETLFHRLLLRLVHWSQEEKGGSTELSHNQAELYVDEYHQMIVRILPRKRSFIQVAIMRPTFNGVNEQVQPSTCKEVINVLDNNLMELCSIWKNGIGFIFKILCDNALKAVHFHELDKCLKAKTIQCGNDRIDPKMTQLFFGGWKSKQATAIVDLPHTTTEDDEQGPSTSTRTRYHEPSRGVPSKEMGEPSKACKIFKMEEREENKVVFQEFLTQLSNVYSGTTVFQLRCLLTDKLSISLLSSENIFGINLFNRLHIEEVITCTNVEILSEIAMLTKNAEAKRCIDEYKQCIKCEDSKGTQFKPYRKALYYALNEVDCKLLPYLIQCYKLDAHTFNDIWTFVFYLEVHGYLDESKDRIERFALKLNKRASDICLGITPFH